MSAARKVDGWTATFSAATPVGASHAHWLCERWRQAKPGREVRTRDGEPVLGEPPFIIETREPS